MSEEAKPVDTQLDATAQSGGSENAPVAIESKEVKEAQGSNGSEESGESKKEKTVEASKASAETSESKLDEKSEQKSEEKLEDKSEEKSEKKSEKKPDEKPDEKSDEKPEEKSEEKPEVYQEFKPEDVLKQVEFYFSDWNLPKDKFLWRTVQSNNEGWVSIKTIASFNRMKKFRPIEAVVDALKNSKFLDVSENGELVKRKTPISQLNGSEKQLRFQRSVYAKGFGEETETTQVDLEAWFGQFGKVNEVRLRRDENKKFKESVFVEFADLEMAKNFVDLTPKPCYKEKELLIMSKPAYVEMKAQNQNFGGDNKFRKRKMNAFKQHKRGPNSKRHKE